MTDYWNEELRCPQCSKTGLARLFQPQRAEMPTVEALTSGFKAVETEYGPNFHCGTCNILADP